MPELPRASSGLPLNTKRNDGLTPRSLTPRDDVAGASKSSSTSPRLSPSRGSVISLSGNPDEEPNTFTDSDVAMIWDFYSRIDDVIILLRKRRAFPVDEPPRETLFVLFSEFCAAAAQVVIDLDLLLAPLAQIMKKHTERRGGELEGYETFLDVKGLCQSVRGILEESQKAESSPPPEPSTKKRDRPRDVWAESGVIGRSSVVPRKSPSDSGLLAMKLLDRRIKVANKTRTISLLQANHLLFKRDAFAMLREALWSARDREWEDYSKKNEIQWLRRAKARETELVYELAAQEVELTAARDCLARLGMEPSNLKKKFTTLESRADHADIRKLCRQAAAAGIMVSILSPHFIGSHQFFGICRRRNSIRILYLIYLLEFVIRRRLRTTWSLLVALLPKSSKWSEKPSTKSGKLLLSRATSLGFRQPGSAETLHPIIPRVVGSSTSAVCDESSSEASWCSQTPKGIIFRPKLECNISSSSNVHHNNVNHAENSYTCSYAITDRHLSADRPHSPLFRLRSGTTPLHHSYGTPTGLTTTNSPSNFTSQLSSPATEILSVPRVMMTESCYICVQEAPTKKSFNYRRAAGHPALTSDARLVSQNSRPYYFEGKIDRNCSSIPAKMLPNLQQSVVGIGSIQWRFPK